MIEDLTYTRVKMTASLLHSVYLDVAKAIDVKAPLDEGLQLAVQRLANIKNHLYRHSSEMAKSVKRSPAKYKQQGQELDRRAQSVLDVLNIVQSRGDVFTDPTIKERLGRAYTSLNALAAQFPRPR